MPVSKNTAKATTRHRLKVPQARVLAALVPEDTTWPQSEWPLLNRANLGVNSGYTAISGSITRALDGIKDTNRTSGDPHPGLLALGYVEKVVLDIDGITEVNYRATIAGAVTYLQWVIDQGGKLREVKDKATCTNKRYKKESS